MKSSKETLIIGVLLAALASACAPKVKSQAAGAKTEAVTKDGASNASEMKTTAEEAEATDSADQVMKKMLREATAIRREIENKMSVECMRARPGQVHLLERAEDVQSFQLDLTCLGKVDAGADQNNHVLRVLVGGRMNLKTEEIEFDSADQYQYSQGTLSLLPMSPKTAAAADAAGAVEKVDNAASN